ncbi:hypothetical protein [Rhodopirellula sallentina]|uniref:Uncharacterized protein n=1 Tax=Rhodopirellula sallentina SM41 TaxID=1263870 RepID=M5UEJ4_9BACT|nr:hypothetical protein [Rhodopirellula sallentina]EMI56266.1 hypothetical protein RSSM_02285 [Rhodopirellula sallentina SM41]
MSEPYIFDDTDREVVKIAMHLLGKIWQSELVSDKDKEVVAAMGSLLNDSPDVVHEYFDASLTLTGPRRQFGDHEIYHYWTVEFQGGEIHIGAGGHFYRPTTGGDSFRSFSWDAVPGAVTDCHDYSDNLRIVDDAQPFGSEVMAIDLSEAGYQLRLEFEAEQLGDDEEDDFEECDSSASDGGSDSAQFAVCLWAFMDADTAMIYALAGRAYSLSGTDEEILSVLRKLSRHDFRSVGRVKVPSRFSVVGPDGCQSKGFVSPSVLKDPNAFLFNEVLDKLHGALPPMPDYTNGKPISQSLGDNPLMCQTLVYEDAAGNCHAIVDADDVAWLQRRTQGEVL